MKKLKLGICLITLIIFIFPAKNLLAQMNRGAGVPIEALPNELKGLEIKDYFISTSAKKVGVIHALTGNVVVTHRATKEAYYSNEGDILYENDSLNTLTDSRCRIKLFDDDVVTMGPDTVLSLDSFQDNRKEGKKSALFSMMKGKAVFYAMRLFRYKEMKFRLKTPAAVVGIRGTKFGVHVYWKEEEKRSSAGVRVADSSHVTGKYLAAVSNKESRKSYTDCFSEDGYLDVNGRIVGPGQMYKGETKEIIPIPYEVLTEFEEAVTIESDDKKIIRRKMRRRRRRLASIRLRRYLGRQYRQQNPTDTQSDTVQTETSNQTIESNPKRPTTHQGYFAVMLTQGLLLSNRSLDHLFATIERQDFDSDSVTSQGDLQTDSLEIRGGSPVYGNAYLGQVIFNGIDSGDLGQTRPIKAKGVGYNSYQEWGYWLMKTPFKADDGKWYGINNKAWWIVGDPTPYENIAGFHGTVRYTGKAYDTYWTGSGGVDMSGNFECNVNLNLSSNQITGLDLSVSNSSQGYSASISGEKATFDTNSTHFVSSDVGTWTLTNPNNSGTPGKRKLYGSLYGPKGENIGGTWAMEFNSQNAAVGIFGGKR